MTMQSYFPHDSNARNDEKLVRLRMKYKSAGYGVYFMILERMRCERNYMCAKDYNMIAFDLREDASLVKSVVEDFGLFEFTDDQKFFYSKSFLERMKSRETVSKVRAEAGKKGGAARRKQDEEQDTNTTQETEPAAQPSAPTTRNNELSFEEFTTWMQKNTPELLQMKPPSEDQWTEIKWLYCTRRKLEKAFREIAANEPFRKKWKYLAVALEKWKEHDQRIHPEIVEAERQERIQIKEKLKTTEQ